MDPITTDIAILGAGPGGYAAAFLAADLGKQVVLIDRQPNPGGVCLYRGCIPSKALLHAAEVIREAAHAETLGVSFGKPTIDREKLSTWRQSIVDGLTGGLGKLSKRRGVTFIQGDATVVNNSQLKLETPDGIQFIRFDHCVLATGSSPAFPPMLSTESDLVWGSTEALELRQIPEKLLVVGGGYIGLEMATVYSGLGSDVTVVEFMDRLLPGADKDLVRVLSKSLKTQVHDIRLKTGVEELREENGKVTATIRHGDTYSQESFDAVLIATGRKPNTTDLGLENTNIQIDDHGFVAVDTMRQTAEPSIYAIGDITGQPMLAHKASREGRVAVEAICGKPTGFEPAAIPAVVFTQPELAWAGITEAEAKEQSIAVEVGRFPWGASGRAKTLGDVDGLTKLIFDPETHRLLGCGMVGPGSGEMIAEATLAIEMGANAHDLALTIHAHPTLSETIMESAESIFGTATHIYKPKKN